MWATQANCVPDGNIARRRLRTFTPKAVTRADRIPAQPILPALGRGLNDEVFQDVRKLSDFVSHDRPVAMRGTRAIHHGRRIPIGHDSAAVWQRGTHGIYVSEHVQAPSARRIAKHLQLHLRCYAQCWHLLRERYGRTAGSLLIRPACNRCEAEPILGEHTLEKV